MISTYDIESVLEIYFYYKDFIKIIHLITISWSKHHIINIFQTLQLKNY